MSDTVTHKVSTTENLLHMFSHIIQFWRIKKPRRTNSVDLLAAVSNNSARVHQGVKQNEALLVDKCDFDRHNIN